MSRVKRITGASLTPTYSVWQLMKRRCDSPKWPAFHRYGGRGITYDPRWARFENFLADMGFAPPGLTLERKDNDGNYTKENCCWATYVEQQNNKCNNVIVEFRGERYTVAQLARARGMTHGQLYKRLQRGWPVERAATAPIDRHAGRFGRSVVAAP